VRGSRYLSRPDQNWGIEVKSITLAVTLALAATLNTAAGLAGPDKDRIPPGQMKKGNVPPGLAKQGGLPPGIAKKYRVGESIPRGEYVLVEDRYRDRLPCGSPQGREWGSVRSRPLSGDDSDRRHCRRCRELA
jgi:hypothetical protein